MEHTIKALKKNGSMSIIVTIIALVLIASSIIERYEPRLAENRWYRDLTHITPFHSVKLHSSKITDYGLKISGEMIKRRCEFEGVQAYAVFENAPREAIFMDTAMEDKERPKGNRPPSKESELWGFWRLYYDGETPLRFEVFANHTNCNSNPTDQSNLFIYGNWKDYDIKSSN